MTSISNMAFGNLIDPTLEAKRLGLSFRTNGDWINNQPAYELVCDHTGHVLASNLTLHQGYECALNGDFARMARNFGYK